MLKYYFTRIFKTSFLSSFFPAIVLGRATAVSDFDFLIHTINQLCFLAPTVGFLIAAIFLRYSCKQIKILAFNCNIRYSTLSFLSFLFLFVIYVLVFIAAHMVIKYV